ncbi:MAG: hypothetical protein IJ088_15580 [Clostridia bacterium]|nr:hypothetical protein [Clostridia bacterium]
METQAVLAAYIEAVMPEQEQFIRQRALRKAESITAAMRPGDAQDYLESQAFQNLVSHLMRTDRVYQGMRHGELLLDRYREELDRLTPLIVSELEAGNPIDLEFLRSVSRSRVPLSAARKARQRMATGAPASLMERHMARWVQETEWKTEQYLRAGELRELVGKENTSEQVVTCLMETRFRRGISAETLDLACGEAVRARIRREIHRRYPELSKCQRVLLPGGETVQTTLDRDIVRAEKMLVDRTRKRFSSGRIRKLLSANASLRELQRVWDTDRNSQKALRHALLNAVPEHYRDLYPLAREMHRRFVLHLGPTNSGKTHESVLRLHSARCGIYLGPLRLLAAEQFETLNLAGVPCSLVTGEEQIRVEGSYVQSSTVEMADLGRHYDVAVIDEGQMITDRDRGGAWTDAILGLCADEIHVCASPDAEQLLTRIITDCGDELTIVRHERMTPLVVEKEGFRFPESVRTGDALIVFSKARVHAVAAELKSLGYRVSLIYGALPPDVRRDQAERFHLGETDVVVSTDAIAMGMNLPIERVVFLESEKYDGDITRPLNTSEIRQIAGRAGRYGIYDVGYVNAFGFKGMIAQALGRSFYPLTEAVIRFPDSLLGIPLPLTQIINRWLAMKDRDCFTKASTVRMAQLAAMLENRNTDKMLLYRFLCIPFDETDPDLLARWRRMYHAETVHEHVEVVAELPGYVNPEECTIEMLDRLEADYRRCDLYYNYARVFLPNPEPILEEIGSRKSLISKGIIHILSTQKLQARSCEFCHTRLPWNWPYRVCDSCYRRHQGNRTRGGPMPDQDDFFE